MTDGARETGTKIPARVSGAQKAAKTRARNKAAADALAQVNAQRLAQIINLHIAGVSLDEIGLQIGATAEEVDRIIASGAARYVRSQPALRTYVRNYISERYSKLLEAVWTEATTPGAPHQFDAQMAAVRSLERMGRLHGADAPTQTEVKVDAAPEAVERMVAALAAGRGLDYDMSVFDGDVVDAEVVHEAVEQTEAALDSAGVAVEEPQPGDRNWNDLDGTDEMGDDL